MLSTAPIFALPADEVVDERLTALQTKQRTLRDSIDNLATMVRSLLPPDSATYAAISAYETELNLDRAEFLALTATSSLSLVSMPVLFRYKTMLMSLADIAVVVQQAARTSQLTL